ncbi:MAG TPA: antitoxin Xre/MbcA/ParS toxin-binding domain-containing protein [Anaeromyxobacter sp.]|nr:antitoxin Xre/MbcA/ParS toxin-binding domain-containing protein [Anaeromyxobacter sp.]
MTTTDKALSILGGKKLLAQGARHGRKVAPARRGSARRGAVGLEEGAVPVPLGIEPGEVRWVEIIRSGLPSESLERTAGKLKLSVNDLSLRLGLPPRTVHRRVQKGERLTPDETEKNVRAARALAKAQQVLGDDDGRLWLLEPSRALGGEVPITLLDTADGFTAVMDELGRLEYGVVS